MHAPAAAAKVALLAGLLATVSVTPTLARSSPADDPEVTEAMWLDAAREHFRGSIVVGKDLMEI